MSTQAEAIAAFEEVKQAIQALRDEYDSVRQDIAATQARLAVLPIFAVGRSEGSHSRLRGSARERIR